MLHNTTIDCVNQFINVILLPNFSQALFDVGPNRVHPKFSQLITHNECKTIVADKLVTVTGNMLQDSHVHMCFYHCTYRSIVCCLITVMEWMEVELIGRTSQRVRQLDTTRLVFH